jgi:hypothetical protein
MARISVPGANGKAVVKMRPKDLLFAVYEKPKNIEGIATRASNQGIYTVNSEVRSVHYFFEDGFMVLGTPNGHIRMTMDRAEQIANELLEIIPEVRQHERSGRHIMDSRSIGKMLEGDFQ